MPWMNQSESMGMGLATGITTGIGGMNTLIEHPDTPMIKNLVQQREQARARKDFARSDELRNQLKAMGVEVFDKEKMWKASSGASGVVLGYRGAGGPTDLEITTLVLQREKARQNSDFGTSDMIRNELRAAGVEIYDKEKTWKAGDGRQGPIPSFQQVQALQAGGCAGGLAAVAAQMQPMLGAMAGMSPQNQAAVMQALAAAQKSPAAQTMQLMQASGASAALNVAGAQSPEYQKAMEILGEVSSSGRTVPDQEIEWLVGVREKLRYKKDFTSADNMRNTLRNALGLELLEKEKRWTTNDGRSGTIPMWSDLQ
mmetsp:Transcript_2460/g.4615  ORF Transcript_2460/g.4615 Transcript_2460/m.4615 type:complete len:313 (-) Transcript_2460:137-1075(-)